MPARFCERCSMIIMGPVSVVEISRLTHREPELERQILCADCCSAVRSFLACRPEPAALEPIPADPPLRVVMR
jgi:hypothetical protein